MVGQLKEDVAEWYQGLSAPMRIEAMCTLIDLSMPFEIRFLGSLIEHLGRKDFGSLRDAESKANSFANGSPDDKKKLIKSLAEVATGSLGNGTQYANPLMHPNNFNDSPANRPSPTHTSESKGRLIGSEMVSGSDHLGDHNLTNEPSNTHDLGPKGITKASSVSNHIGCSSEEETESMCIVNDHKRRKLILYISVLTPTNHDGANLYYTILSDIEDTPALAWLEELDKDAHEEVSLLYTLASRHPAFTFEQRTFLGTVANRVNEITNSKFSRVTTTPQTAQAHTTPGTHPIYFNHTALPQAMDPKYSGYYIFTPPPMHIQQSPHQPTVSNNGEQIRNTTVTAPFPTAYGPYPYFVSHPHHPPLTHPTALNPQYNQNLIGPSIPIGSSPVVAGQNLQQAPVAQGSIVSNNHLSKGQNPQTHVSASNSLSQQSCLSTPSRTSSVPFQSEANSVDGDSEESSENCDWNSPESSPFESPPQSLTPSRSQSPPSGVPNSTPVQAVSLSGHSSTFLVTSSGSSVPYGGASGNTSSVSSSSTIVKTEIHTSSGLVITTATASSTSCSTSASNVGNGNVNSSSANITPKASTGTIHHQTHHPPPPQPPSTVRGQPKTVSVSSNQSFSNHPVTAMSSSVITVSQHQQTLPQMIGPAPVHMQPQATTSVNNVGGVVSHSMSSNTPLVAFPQTHGAHNSLGHNSLPSQNSYPCFPQMSVSFAGMNAGAAYRTPSQGVLTRNPYVQPHTNALLNNQMVIKGADQRGLSVHGSLRQKTPLQNTPKRRSNVTGVSGLAISGVGPHNSQSTSGKGDEVSETKDRTNEIVVSANPSKNAQQQERTSAKSYHHVANGLVNALTNPGGGGAGGVLPCNPLPLSASNSGIISNQPTIVGINSSSTPGGQIMQTAAKGEDGLLGDGAVLDNYPVNQLPYHVNGPQLYGHPGAYIQLPNGYMTSSYYHTPMGTAPVPPSTEIMMNPAGVSHFSFPFTIPQSFSSPPSVGKGINAKDTPKTSNLHNSGLVNTAPSGTESGKTIQNQHDNHSGPYPRTNLQPLPIGCFAVAPTPSQPNRHNRGVILDIGGALGNSSISPVNVDVAVMPPLEELVETVHRPRKISCYNCGASTHLGPDCKEGSMEEMTRHQFRINYSGPSSVAADGKDGD